MAIVNKQMKTFNVPNGNNTNRYEIVDDKGRKCIALDWDANSTRAFAVGEYTIKDGVVYKFKTAHAANTSWSASEVTATNLGAEIGDLKTALNKVESAAYKYTGNMLDFGIIGGTWGQGNQGGSEPYMCHTEKIPVTAGETVYGVINGTKMAETSALSSYTLSLYVKSYTADDTLIDTTNLSNTSGQTTGSYTIPNNCTYIIVTLSSGVWGNQFTPTTLDNAVEAFAYVGYDNISYTDVLPNLVGYPEYNNNLIQKTDDKVDELNDDIHNAFDYKDNRLTVSGTKNAAIRTTAGAEDTSAVYANCSYITISITSEYVGKKIFVSGIAWYMVVPYVFVGQSSVVRYPTIENPGSTVTQYTDIEFIPDEPGTLYVNNYTNKVAYACTKDIGDIKSTHFPENIEIYDVINYAQITPLTIIQGKLLNGSTGEITDSTNNSYRVTDYTDISGKSKLLVSSEHFWGQGLYAFYDSSKTYISGYSSASSGTVTILRNVVVDIPANAKYIVIGFLYQSNFTSPVLFAGEGQVVNNSAIWAGKKWSCIGDSLTEIYGVTDIHYFEYISALTGISTVNLGASGNGYAQGANNFMTKGLLVPSDSDVVTIFGSGNDASSGKQLGTASDTGTDTIAGCINTTIDNIYSVLPVVNLGIVTPTPWVNNMPYDDGFMESYSNLIVAICRSRSIPCLDLYHESNLNPNSESVRSIAYSKDNGGGVHPNEIGHKMIAAQFKAFLQKLILY